MERLQAAIDKARAQRNRRRGASGQRFGAPDAPTEADAAWAALHPLALSRRHLKRHRVVSAEASQASAPYDILRTRVLQQAQANGWRRIAIASPHSGGGKTTTVANLAFGLTRHAGVRTILMDMDLRRSGLARVLGQKGHDSMGAVLQGTVPFSQIARRHGTSLAFGFGFGSARSPAEILKSAEAQHVLEQIEQTYTPDLMLFDMPPLNAGDDNLGFLTRVDAALLIVEADRTSLSQIDVAERQIAELTNVMGIVLNKYRHTAGAYGYDEAYY